jgi:hypothetical protein
MMYFIQVHTAIVHYVSFVEYAYFDKLSTSLACSGRAGCPPHNIYAYAQN